MLITRVRSSKKLIRSAILSTLFTKSTSTPAAFRAPSSICHPHIRPLVRARAFTSSPSRMSSSKSLQVSFDKPQQPIHFGPFEVTNQVFLTTPHTFALVNLKPLLPGHVLVCPLRPHKRLTGLSPTELTDLWSCVQLVQRMLARYYFTSSPSPSPSAHAHAPNPKTQQHLETLGSFNIALQDGPEAGQTVPHVHVHVIPRIRGSTAKETETPSDELYDRMAEEDGNVGGWLWDSYQSGKEGGVPEKRPHPGGKFPRIEDAERMPRGMAEMEAEAEGYRTLGRGLWEEEQGGDV